MKKFLLLALLPLAQVAHAGPKVDVYLNMPLVAPAPLYVHAPPVQYRNDRRVIRTYEPQYYGNPYPTVIYNDYGRRDYYYRERHARPHHSRGWEKHRDRDWERRYDRDNYRHHYHR